MRTDKNHRRALVCNRLKAAGFPGAREVKRRYERLHGKPIELAEVADTFLKIADHCEAKLLGGKARLTGKTRTFGRAIAAEIRCARCGLTFWETGLPWALCVDCRK